jgi:hypothetical protein
VQQMMPLMMVHSFDQCVSGLFLSGLGDDPLDNAGADTERPANLEDAVTIGSQLQYARFDGSFDPTPA